MIRDTSTTDIVRPKQKFRLKLSMTTAALGLGFVAIVAAYPTYRDWSDTERSYPLDRVRVAQVMRGPFEHSVAADGKIVAVIKPTLFASAAGVITLKVKPGDIVEKGQVLGDIVNPDLVTQLRQAESTLLKSQVELSRQRLDSRQRKLETEQGREVSQVKLEAARRNLARYEKALKDGTVSRQDYEKSQDEVAIAESSHTSLVATNRLLVERLDFELQSKDLEVQQQNVLVDDLKRQVDELIVRAPIAGQVGTVQVEDQDSVALRQALMTVVDLTAYGVLIQVPESYANDLSVGLPTVITYEGKAYRGEITSLSPEVIGNNIEARAKFVEAPAGDLKQNQRVSLKIVFQTVGDAVTLARGPFVESGGGRTAYVVEGNRARSVPIRLGAIGASEVEVLEGLKPGEKVVISNTQVFENASKVLLR